LTKCKAAKKFDKVRGGWQERYFVLKGSMLSYYKKQGDGTAKGEIDLNLAKIDDADAKTTKNHSIRVEQARQVFTYLIAQSHEDKLDWIYALRKAAGYDESEWDITKVRAPVDQPKGPDHVLCCFSTLMVSADGSTKHSIIIIEANGDVSIGNEKNIIARKFHAASIEKITCSTSPDVRLATTTGVSYLFSLSFTVSQDSSSTSFKFYLGTVEEANQCTDYMKMAKRGDLRRFNLKKLMECRLQIGSVRVSEKEWLTRWCVLAEHRLVIFKDMNSNVPCKSLFLCSTRLSKSGKLAIAVNTGIEQALVKFENETLRELWWEQAMEQVVQEGTKSFELPDAEQKCDVSSDMSFAPPPPDHDPTDEVEIVTHVPTLEADESTFVIAWGYGEQGQLGSKSKDNQLFPSPIPSLNSKKVRSISAGKTHAAAVTDKGHVFVWGSGPEYQLGLGKANTQAAAPYLVTSLIAKGAIGLVACGDTHTLALNTLGQVYSWGTGLHGQLGLGDGTTEAPYPVLIPSVKNVQMTHISAGTTHSASISAAQDLYTWGDASQGAVGTGNKANVHSPWHNTYAPKCTTVACGNGFTAVVSTDKQLFSWGLNEQGQLGHGDSESRYLPDEVKFFGKQRLYVKQVSLGAAHVICITEKISTREVNVFTWGKGVANGFQKDQKIPALVAAFKSPLLATSSCSSNHSTTLNNKLQMFAFGINEYGELGNGQPGVPALVRVRLTCEAVVATACGDKFTVALCKGAPPEKLHKKAADPAPEPAPDHSFNAFSSFVNSSLGKEGGGTDATVGKLLASMQLKQKAEEDKQDVAQAAFKEIGGSLLSALANISQAEKSGDSETSTNLLADLAQKLNQSSSSSSSSTISGQDDGGGGGQVSSLSASVSSPALTSSSSSTAAAAAPASLAVADTLTSTLSSTVDSDGGLAIEAGVKKKKKKPLPEGWKKVKDPNTGRSYYYNKETRETSWRRPASEETA